MSLPHDSQEHLPREDYVKRLYAMQVTTLFALIAMLGLNAYLLFVSTDTVVMNVDLARLAESDHFDAVEHRLEGVEERLDEHARQLGLAELEAPYADMVASLD